MNETLLKLLDNREQNYPYELEKQYPRVLNKILAMWNDPAIDSYFSDLMVSNRPDRKGFPPLVASDIMNLSLVHARKNNLKIEVDPWGNEKAKVGIEKLGLNFTSQGFIKACEAGKISEIALFLSSGMDINTSDERHWTPLMIAAHNGNEEMVELLLKSGADIQHKDIGGYNPLHWAALNGHERIVKLLIDKLADVNARSKHGWTALLQAATRGHLAVCKILIEKGAGINAATNDGWTPLHKAAANGHLDVVKLLISKGANIGAQYSDGTTALDIAKKNKHEQIVAILSDAG